MTIFKYFGWSSIERTSVAKASVFWPLILHCVEGQRKYTKGKQVRISLSSKLLMVILLSATRSDAFATLKLPDATCTIAIAEGKINSSYGCGPNYSFATIADTIRTAPAEGSTEFKYYFLIEAPLDFEVAVKVEYELYAGISLGSVLLGTNLINSASAQATITVQSDSGTISSSVNTRLTEFDLAIAQTSLNVGNLQIDAVTNKPYLVSLYSNFYLYGVGSAIAFADPTVTFDSSLFPDASLLLSSGASNSNDHQALVTLISSVPEPATVFLLTAGIAGISIRLRPLKNQKKCLASLGSLRQFNQS